MKTSPIHSQNPRISLALQDLDMRVRLEHVLIGAGYEVVNCAQPDDLSKLVADTGALSAYELAIWDMRMLNDDSVRRIENLQARDVFPPLILITAFSDNDAFQRFCKLKTVAYFDMPLETYQQLTTVLRILPL